LKQNNTLLCFHLDNHQTNANVEIKQLTKRVYNVIKLGHPNVIQLIATLEQVKNSNKLAISAFVFLTLTDFYEETNLPLVYNNFYLFQMATSSIITLLSQAGYDSSLSKGIYLFHLLVSRFGVETLNGNILELDSIVNLVKSIIQVMVHCGNEVLRKSATNCFNHFFKTFNKEGRIRFVYYFIQLFYDRSNETNTNESLNNYATSYLIYLFKEEINERFKDNSYNLRNAPLESDLNLFRILKVI
jgi:hypothetical protein